MAGPFGHKGHLVRVAVLFVAGILVFLGLQAFLVPDGFGAYGHYRAGALDDNRVPQLVYGGREACAECHAEVPELLQRGAHARVRCEACHGPLARHAQDPSAGDVVKPDVVALCARCHDTRAARPAGFPQVNASEHSGGERCTSCHQAHDPLDAASSATPAAPPGPAAPAGKGGTR
jgi:hypothetical protein